MTTAYMGFSTDRGWSLLDAATWTRSHAYKGVWWFRTGCLVENSDDIKVVVRDIDPRRVDDLSRRAKRYLRDEGLARVEKGRFIVNHAELTRRLAGEPDSPTPSTEAVVPQVTERSDSADDDNSLIANVFANGEGFEMDIAPGVDLSVPDVIGESAVILGIKGSGKSQTAGVLAEELLKAGVPMGIIDIAGEYFGLREQFPVLIAGKQPGAVVDVAVTPDQAGALAEYSLRNGESVIFDVSEFKLDDREAAVQAFFERLWEVAGELRRPYIVLLEEAHNYIPQSSSSDLKKLLIQLATEGRKRGLSIIMVSQRPARIDKNVLAQAGIKFLHRATLPNDLANYTANIPSMIMSPSEVKAAVFEFAAGEALALYGKVVKAVQVRKRHTYHAGYTPGMEAIQRPLALAGEDQTAKIEALRALLGGGSVADSVTVATGDSTAQLRARIKALESEVFDRGERIAELEELLAGGRNPEYRIMTENLSPWPSDDSQVKEFGFNVFGGATLSTLIKSGRGYKTREDARSAARDIVQSMKSAPINDADEVIERRAKEAAKIERERQERAVDQLINRARMSLTGHRRDFAKLLAACGKLTQREAIKKLSIATSTFRAPLELLDAGLITKTGHGLTALYEWRAYEKISSQYPALDASTVIARILK